MEVADGAGSVAVTRAEDVDGLVEAITSAVGSHPLEVLEVTVVAVGMVSSVPAVPLPNCTLSVGVVNAPVEVACVVPLI